MRGIIAFVLVVVLSLSPAIAGAEPSASAQTAAREAFADGERSFSRGAYPEALASFERAFRLVSHDAVRFNIAVCLERLQRYREARDQYRAAAQSTMLGPDDRARAEKAVERVGHELGMLVVDGAAGEPVAIDGEVRCSVPCKIDLDPHAYRVAVGSAAPRPVRIERGGELRLERAAREPATVTATPAPNVPAAPHARGPGWLTWAGAVGAAVGTGGAVAFGVRTQILHTQYVDAPSVSTRDQGIFARAMTNVSLGVALVGIALVAVDLFAIAPTPRTERR